MKKLGKASYVAICLLVEWVVNSFVTQKLWAWIAMPLFGFDSISLSGAFGISIMISFLTQKPSINKSEKDGLIEGITKALIAVLIRAAMYLFSGFIASLII